MSADVSNLVTCPHCNGAYKVEVMGGGGGKPTVVSAAEQVKSRVLSSKNNWIVADQARYRLEERLLVDMKNLDRTGEYISKDEAERLLGELQSYCNRMETAIWCLGKPKIPPEGVEYKWWYDKGGILRTDFDTPYLNGRVTFNGHSWLGTLYDGMSAVFHSPVVGTELEAVLAVEKAFNELMVARGLFTDPDLKNRPAGGVGTVLFSGGVKRDEHAAVIKCGVGPYDPDNPAVLGDVRFSGGAGGASTDNDDAKRGYSGLSPNLVILDDPHITCKVHEIPRHVQDKINDAFARGEADREKVVDRGYFSNIVYVALKWMQLMKRY